MRDLSGVDGDRERCVTLQDLALVTDEASGVIDVGRVKIFGACGSVAETLAECAKLSASDRLAMSVQLRLGDVCDQIQHLGMQSSHRASLHGLINTFVSLLTRFYGFIKSKDRRSTSSWDPWSMQSASQRDPATVLSLHLDLDRLMSQHDLDNTHKVHKWRPTWTEVRAKLQQVSLNTFLRQPSAGSKRTCDGVVICRAAFEVSKEAQALTELGVSLSARSTSFRHKADTTPSPLSRWFLAPSEIDIQLDTKLGRGSFGAVHFGRWFDTPVVVKRVFVDPKKKAALQIQFRHEADVWFQLNHINVVKMYGACDVGDPFFVCEYANGGTLDKYLEREGRGQYLVWYSLLSAALGLQYLHDNGVVHGDLKANNILVGADNIVKLADFGLSTLTGQVNAGATVGALGAYRWKAPECLHGNAATFASDVYSFAMVMIEVVSGKPPWGNLRDHIVRYRVEDGELPTRPHGIALAEWLLIERMCCFNPSDRVTIDAVVVHLLSLLEHMDMSILWPSVRGAVPRKPFKNRIASREGTLLSLLALGKSKNTRLSKYAADHLLAVHISRGSQSSQREIDGIVDILATGGEVGKTWAAQALHLLAWGNDPNRVAIVVSGAIDPLVAMLRDGTGVQREKAAVALSNLAVNADNKMSIAVAGAIDPLVAMLRDGTEVQRMRL